MAEPFKNLIDAAAVQAIAHHLQRAWPAFDAPGFSALALQGLNALELKARVLQVARALVAHLPADADRACGILEASLGPPGEGDDLQGLRRELVRRTEREVAELSIAIARRVVQRELALDQDLVLAMARVALDRLGDVSAATIRLHPDDYAAAMAGRGGLPASAPGVQILSDPAIQRGGCLVQSPFGSIDVGAATQIDELTHTLLGDDGRGAVRPLGFRDDAAA